MRSVRSPAAPGRSRIYEKIISDALQSRRYESIAELVGDVKERCARLRVSYAHHEIDEAITVMRERLQREVVAPSNPVEKPEVPQPLTHDEACVALRQLAERFGSKFKVPGSMPAAKPLEPRQADRRAALRVVMTAIADQARRCDEVER